MNHNYTAHCQNVTIRPLQTGDIEFLRVWRNDENNTKYLRKLPYITQDMQKKWYENYLQNEDEFCFSIIETELQRVVGSLSLYNFKGNTAEFGKILIGDSEAHGRNTGYNAIMAVIGIAFNELHLERIVLRVYAENSKALHLYEKVGFRLVSGGISEGMEEYHMELTQKDIEKI